MSEQEDKRRRLLGRLSRHVAYTAPALVLMAGSAVIQATAADGPSTSLRLAPVTEASFLLASNHGEAEGEAQAEAEGEAEGEATVPASAVKRPVGYTPGYSETGENSEEMLARGEELYYDTSLSSNGLSCASCHGSDGNDMRYLATFEQPYPHQVAMGSNLFGMSEVHADEMVQICIVSPMEADPLEWGSDDLMSLSAYMVEVQRRFAGEPHDL